MAKEKSSSYIDRLPEEIKQKIGEVRHVNWLLELKKDCEKRAVAEIERIEKRGLVDIFNPTEHRHFYSPLNGKNPHLQMGKSSDLWL